MGASERGRLTRCPLHSRSLPGRAIDFDRVWEHTRRQSARFCLPRPPAISPACCCRPLRERYDLRLTDARSTNRQGQPAEAVIVADLLAAPAAELASLVAGVDAIVHCAYHRPAGDDIQSQYDSERRNVDLMQRVYQLALDHGVRRVVAASTNQAASGTSSPTMPACATA